MDKTEKESRQVGVEPTAFCLGNRRSIHWATGALRLAINGNLSNVLTLRETETDYLILHVGEPEPQEIWSTREPDTSAYGLPDRCCAASRDGNGCKSVGFCRPNPNPWKIFEPIKNLYPWRVWNFAQTQTHRVNGYTRVTHGSTLYYNSFHYNQ